MKRFAIILAAAAVVCSCGPKKATSPYQKMVDKYAVVTIKTPDLSGITKNGKEVLNLYRFAADEADKIYWEQALGHKTEMEALEDDAQKTYAMINYGPWDRLDGKAFVDGYGVRPAGLGFYPEDMTDEEFAELADPDKNSPYTLIRRAEDGSLKVVWYHDAYKEQIDKINDYLIAAADITIKESVRKYLLAKSQALESDNYYQSNVAWLGMEDSKMDLIIGPNETNDDQRYGIKASYGAFVLLKDQKNTDRLASYLEMIPELQKDLPVEEKYKGFTPGTHSDIFVYDAIYYAGGSNAGIKHIAVNLPYDTRVQEEIGTRTALLKNVMDEKFNRIVLPTGRVLFDSDMVTHVDKDAFFWNIAFREVAHGLGVKQTLDGRDVNEALGTSALTWEEAKGNIVGEWLVLHLLEQQKVAALFTKEDAIATFVANIIRSQRFGEGEALGRANIMCYNYLSEQGAFSRSEAGTYKIDFAKAEEAITSLAGLILKTQAVGDKAAADRFEARYSKLSEAFMADLVNLSLDKIPADIRLIFE